MNGGIVDERVVRMYALCGLRVDVTLNSRYSGCFEPFLHEEVDREK